MFLGTFAFNSMAKGCVTVYLTVYFALWIHIMGFIILLSLYSPQSLSYLHALHPSLGVFCLCGRPLAGAELQMMLCNRQETEYEAQQVYLTLPSRAQHSRKGGKKQQQKPLHCNHAGKSRIFYCTKYLQLWLHTTNLTCFACHALMTHPAVT